MSDVVLRAVIYARYSTEMQSAASIEDQARLCRSRIEREGWILTDTYSDRAQSGASTLRAGYQRMLMAARAGSFDILVAEALDRLTRDQEDIAALYKMLSFAGVTLFTLSEGEISELHIGLKGTMNALFLKDLAAKTRRGLEGRVRAGKSGGGLCYGYDVLKAFDTRGEPIRGDRQINRSEATIVHRIFKEYASGRSPRSIACGLNADRIPGPRGSEWGPSTINGNRERGTGILNNELYIGRLIWNRLRYMKDPDTGKRVSRPNTEDVFVVVEAPELRIVPQVLWAQVRARQEGLTHLMRRDAGRRNFWEKQRPRHLITGLAKCGCCGSSYVKVGLTRFGCAGAKDRGTCKNRLTIDGHVLEQGILELLKTRLMAPEPFKAFCDEFHRELNRLRSVAQQAVEAHRQELATIERRIKKIIAVIADDDAPVRSLKAELVSLEARADELVEAIENHEAPEPVIHPGVSEVYRRQVAALHSALDDPESHDEAFELIRSLIEQIKLIPQDGELLIELRGALGGILSLCSESKKAAPEGADLERQIKLVAGIGFEPMTFRL